MSNVLSRKRSGFTLIELLVVIAVIAILSSLLLPTLSRAKDATHFVKCKSNLRQVFLAVQMYVGDTGVYPDYPTPALVSNATLWHTLLFPYLSPAEINVFNIHGAITNQTVFENYRGVFRCPKDFTSRMKFNYLIGGSVDTQLKQFWRGSYGINAAGSHISPSPSAPLLGLMGGTAGGDPTPPVRDGEVLVPSDMIAVGDGFVIFPDGEIVQDNFLGHAQIYGTPPRKNNAATKRHRGKLNAAFCDRHIEGMNVEHLLFDRSPQLLCKWNRDNQPYR